MKKISLATLLAVGIACGATSAFAVGRAYIATAAMGGSDANTAYNCDIDHPCRWIPTAMTVVDSGGEVVILNSGNYGIFDITKSVSIIAAPGIYTGIAPPAGYTRAIGIDGSGIEVILRGLTIRGVGGTSGIRFVNGAKLTVENCSISGFKYGTNDGTAINVLASGAELRITNSVIRDNNYGIFIGGGGTATISNSVVSGHTTTSGGGAAIYAKGDTAGVTTTLHVNDSVVTGNYWGITAYTDTATAGSRAFVTRSTVSNNTYGIDSDNGGGGTTAVFITGNTVTGNTTGLSITSGATMTSYGNNLVTGNGLSATPTSGTLQ